MLFGDILRLSAKRHPQKTALIGPDGDTSYADLDVLSNRFAHAVASLGLGRGDAVAIMSRNVAEDGRQSAHLQWIVRGNGDVVLGGGVDG